VVREATVLVVGSGPAGIAASIQAHRDLVDHIVVGREPAGGLLPAAWRIDNLPGFPGGIPGRALARRLARQAARLGLPVEVDEVADIELEIGGFLARLASGGAVRARAVILATGTHPRDFSATGAGEVAARGRLHRDARSLPARLSGRSVAILGGGDAALDTALSVHQRGGRASILIRGRALSANPRLVERVAERGIAIETDRIVDRLGVDRTGVRIDPGGLAADHVVVCIGRVPEDTLYRSLVPDGPIPWEVETPIEGLFLAGDLVAGADRYVAAAQGDGQRAMLAAERYLEGVKG